MIHRRRGQGGALTAESGRVAPSVVDGELPTTDHPNMTGMHEWRTPSAWLLRSDLPYLLSSNETLHTQCTLGWDSVFCTCIVHSVRLFFGLSYLYWASFCILHLHPASVLCPLSPASWLWVSFCIPHSASCILHVSHSCSFEPASAFCILHLHPASGAVHSFGADSAFCILHLHLASGAVHSFGADCQHTV